MAVSYKRLWKLLVDKEMSKSDLRKKAEIAPNTMTKLRRDEEVSLAILSKICRTLFIKKLALAVNKSLIDSQKSAIEQQRYNETLKAYILKEYDEIEKKRIFRS